MSDDGWGSSVELLAGLSLARRAHSEAVGRKVASVAYLVSAGVRSDLLTAALLHDVGYAHAATGFHPLDGAQFLSDRGFPVVVCQLVAHHSASIVEARLRKILDSEFDPFTITSDNVVTALHVLTWADMTTGPTGESLDLDERLAEAEGRYGSGSLVVAALMAARPELQAACHFVEGSMKGLV